LEKPLPRRGYRHSIIAQTASGKVDMKTDVLKDKPESPSYEFVPAFDLGKLGGTDQLRNTVI
jgi:hypothetical protein